MTNTLATTSESDRFKNWPPKRIVSELDKHIVGQKEAKKAVAIALRNRLRRQKLPKELQEEVAPKNILMIGPTGVGKTEIARRLARLTGSPFLKVEASKFTEVGYVGRDVESMIRDLVEVSIGLIREEKVKEVRAIAARLAENHILDQLQPRTALDQDEEEVAAGSELPLNREELRQWLRDGRLDDREIPVEVPDNPMGGIKMFGPQGMEEMGMNFKDMFGGLLGDRTKTRVLKVPEALESLQKQEEEKLLDMDDIVSEAIHRCEQSGIIFLDEVDKIAGGGGVQGPDVSREGVQRDLLPIVEGSTVSTKHGQVRTDHMLFIAAGAFHVSKPSDMIPELQGRFPIRVELSALTGDDFVRILTEPESSLTFQTRELLATEGLELEFSEDGIKELAKIAQELNDKLENIGARRLHTVVEKTVEDLSFHAPDLKGTKQVIDAPFVQAALKELLKDQDLSSYIL